MLQSQAEAELVAAAEPEGGGKNTTFALCVPLPSRLGHYLCLVCSAAIVAEAVPSLLRQWLFIVGL